MSKMLTNLILSLNLIVIPVANSQYIGPYATSIKWWLYFISAFLVSILIYLNPLMLPKPNKNISKVVICIFLVFILNNIFQPQPFWSQFNLEVVSFILFLFFGYLLARRNLSLSQQLIKPFTVGLIIFAIYNFFISYKFNLQNMKRTGGSFGNSGLFSQYLSLGIVIYGSQTSVLENTNIKRIFFLFFACALFLLNIGLNSRSVTLGIVLGTTLLFLFASHKHKKKIITFCISIILIICAWILLFGKSASSRFELISETVELQKEYPFGLGIDQFKYASLPFQAKGNFKPDPSRTFENPHSQILNFAIEQGLILFVFVMSLISIFLWKVITKTSQFSSSDKVFLFLSLGLWGIEYLFQFPLDVPLPSFSIAISMGYFVYFISIRRAQFFVVKPFVVVLLICFTAIKLATWTYSRYQFVRSKPNINELKVLRLIDPDFLFWDLELISQQMQSNKSEGLQYSKGLLKKSPFNYNLLALLTIEYSKQKNPEACHLANIFNSTFQKEKHMHIRLKNLNYCMNQKLLSPMQTHRAYKDLKNQLKN